MWKESYRIGVDVIDRQHMELFKMAGDLLEAVQDGKGDRKKECISAINYLKEYTLQHFKDEEDYQKAIKYPGFPEHRMVHQKFVQDVLAHERNMLISDFNTKDVKDFMGMLIAWLVYHVAGADQLIVSEKIPEKLVRPRSPIDSYFQISTCDILNKITDLDIRDIKVIAHIGGDFQSTIVVQMPLSGNATGTVTYKYTKQLAFDLIRSMTSVPPRAIDELVCSAMMEISNIISIKAIGLMASNGFNCKVDMPVTKIEPAFLPSHESIIFDTGMGILEIEVSINKDEKKKFIA